MAKRTLLDLTQNILSALGSDEVNSISDTTESLQVAEIIKTSYFNIVSRAQLPEHKQLFQLTAAADDSSPVLMYKPENVNRIEWIKYFDNNVNPDSDSGGHDVNTDLEDVSDGTSGSAPSYKYVRMLPVEDFLQIVNQYNTNESNVDTMTLNSLSFNYKDDKTPTYCTIIQDYYIVFDSFDSDVDTTLQTSKTECYGQIVPDFDLSDSFIPDMDDPQVPLLLNEAKSLAFFELKQTIHPKAEQEVKRGWSSIQSDKAVSNKPSFFDQLPDFGRRGGGRRSWR